MRYLIPILLIASVSLAATPPPNTGASDISSATFTGPKFRKAATIGWPAELSAPDFNELTRAITDAIPTATAAHLPNVSADQMKANTRITHSWAGGSFGSSSTGGSGFGGGTSGYSSSDSPWRGRELVIMVMEDKIGAGDSAKPLKPDAANAYIAALMDVAREALARQFKQRRNEMLERPNKAVQRAEEHLDSARVKANAIRAEIRNATGRVEVSPEVLRASIASLDADKQRLSLELAGLSMRRKMLQEGVAKFGHDAEKAVADDAIVKELSKIIDARQSELARLRLLVSKAVASQADLGKAEADVAEAQVRLLERKEQAIRAAGGEALADLNKELLTASVNAADAEARLQFIDVSLKKYAATTSFIDDLERSIRDLQRAEMESDAANMSLRQVERIVEELQPPSLN